MGQAGRAHSVPRVASHQGSSCPLVLKLYDSEVIQFMLSEGLPEAVYSKVHHLPKGELHLEVVSGDRKRGGPSHSQSHNPSGLGHPSESDSLPQQLAR